jgi:hypothetical protein
MLTPIGIEKSAADDAHDGDDDELQRLSKGVRQLIYHYSCRLSWGSRIFLSTALAEESQSMEL